MFSVRSERPPVGAEQRHTCDPKRVAGSRRVYYERINLRRLAARGCHMGTVDASTYSAKREEPTDYEAR